MTIYHYNPKWFYHQTLDDDQVKQIENIFGDTIESEDRYNFLPEYTRACAVDSSVVECEEKYKFLEVIDSVFHQFLSEIETKHPAEIICDGIWINKYHTGGFQEFHNHSMPTCNLSMVYVYQDDSGEDQFKFFDPDWQHNRANGLNDLLELPSFEVYAPRLRKCDIILFPSQYGHYVIPHAGKSDRITISGNFKIRRKHTSLGEFKLL